MAIKIEGGRLLELCYAICYLQRLPNWVRSDWKVHFVYGIWLMLHWANLNWLRSEFIYFILFLILLFTCVLSFLLYTTLLKAFFMFCIHMMFLITGGGFLISKYNSLLVCQVVTKKFYAHLRCLFNLCLRNNSFPRILFMRRIHEKNSLLQKKFAWQIRVFKQPWTSKRTWPS